MSAPSMRLAATTQLRFPGLVPIVPVSVRQQFRVVLSHYHVLFIVFIQNSQSASVNFF